MLVHGQFDGLELACTKLVHEPRKIKQCLFFADYAGGWKSYQFCVNKVRDE